MPTFVSESRGLQEAPRARSERGSVLLIALLILVFAGALAMGAVALVGSGTSTSADRVQSEQALYAAESGIRRILNGDIQCDGTPRMVGSGARFDCDEGSNECAPDQGLVRGWLGDDLTNSPAVHHICVRLTGGGLPPCDDDDWTCASSGNPLSPGGGGQTFENLYIEGVDVNGAGNWTVQGDACFGEGVSVSGGIEFQGNVYWEGMEDTSGQASSYAGCVYEAGVLNNSLSGSGCSGDATIDGWCGPAGDGGSDWGYSG